MLKTITLITAILLPFQALNAQENQVETIVASIQTVIEKTCHILNPEGSDLRKTQCIESYNYAFKEILEDKSKDVSVYKKCIAESVNKNGTISMPVFYTCTI